MMLGNNRYFESPGAYITVIAKVPDYDPYLLCGETPEIRKFTVSVSITGFLSDILNTVRKNLSEIKELSDGEYSPSIKVRGIRGMDWGKAIAGGDFSTSNKIIGQVRMMLEEADAYNALGIPISKPYVAKP